MGKKLATRRLSYMPFCFIATLLASHSFTSAHCHQCLNSLRPTTPSFCLRYYVKLSTHNDVMVFLPRFTWFTFSSIFAKSPSSDITLAISSAIAQYVLPTNCRQHSYIDYIKNFKLVITLHYSVFLIFLFDFITVFRSTCDHIVYHIVYHGRK